MSKARNNENQKIESIEPLILMSASAADIGNVIDLTDASIIIAAESHEAAVGTAGDDIIVGLGGDNCLHGGDGDDLFFTTSGNNNEVDGQGGTDTIRYLGNRSDFSVVGLAGGGFVISDDADRIDRVYNVEKFEFNDGVVMAADLLSGNDAPVFTTGQQFYVDENTTAVTTVEATDANGDTLVYSLGTAGDSAFFNIDPNTGVLTFKSGPDFENPLDSNGDNVYDLFVKVTDGKTTTIQSIWVGVKDVDESGGGNQSPFFTNVADGEMIFVAENTTAVKDTDGTDPDGDTVTYSFSDGLGTPGSGFNEDTGSFNIDPNTGVLSFKVAPDFENPGDADGDNEYLVTIVVSDGKGGAQERDVIIKVTDVDESGGGGNNAPVFTNIPADKMVTVDENQTNAFDLAATDADAGDTLVYTITGGADAGLFNIDSATGLLTFKNAPDFETPGDADGQNDYEVNVRVSDGTDYNDDNLIIKVGDVNENGGGGNNDPFFTNVEQNEMVTVFEGNRFVGDANGQDPDGDAVTFSITGGADAARFTIDSATGVLSFVDTPDFENPLDTDGNNEYLVTLQIADGKGGTQSRDVIVKVQDVVEGGGNQSPFFTNVEEGEMVTVVENNTLVGDANGVDPDGDTVTYSISGGVDSALFTVDSATGVVSFINAPDFENPGDVGANNEYNITLRVSDGSLSQDRNVVVKVLDANEGGTGNQSPFFTNVEEGEMVTVVENNTLVGDANGVDPDGDTVTYSISGGVDSALFTVDSATGVVSFINAPDFENPGDVGANNEYNITLRVSDGSLSQDRNVVVKVLDANEGGTGNQSPFFTNVTEGVVVTVPENTTPVGDANAQDPDGDTVTFSIVGGADASLFSVDSATGIVSFITAPDFEAPSDADGNNNYQITLRVSDGNGGTQDRNVTVRVTDVGGEGGTGNRAPFFTNVSEGETVTVPENTTPVGDADGVDPDGDTVTYAIVGGADASQFTINSATGVVSFVNAPDFEAPVDADGNNNYQITLRISDGTLTQDRNVTVRVTDVGNEGGGGGNNQAPFFTNVSQGEVVSVVTGTTAVGDANAQDPNGDTITYSISGGADASLFTVNSATGVVSFINAPDVNNPGDADGNNSYLITLRVSDGTLFQDRSVVVNVIADNSNQGNRAPVFTNVSQGEVVWFDENGTFVGDANAVDADGDALTFSVVGGADASQFTINAQTGELFFISAPDFENPGDANGNNLYELVIRVSDGTASVDRTIGVNVEDVNEGGTGTGGGTGFGTVNQVNQIDLTNIFTQLLNGLSGVHPYTGPSIY